jgi:hypothetical protein
MAQKAAADHVSTVLQNVYDVTDLLDYFDGRIVNGFREFSDPSIAYQYLNRAHALLGEAKEAFQRARAAGWSRDKMMDELD